MAFYINDSLFSWCSHKKINMALSSYEAELIMAVAAACQALWLISLIGELIGSKPKPVALFVDNKSAKALMKNPMFHGCNKHIDTRFHFIHEYVKRKQITVEFVSIRE